MKKIIIGITGGFSSGKSTVSDLLVNKGAYKIDADEIAHTILRGDLNIREKVVDLFGLSVLLDGEIDRRKLGQVVFDDSNMLDSLCAVIHPVIFKCIEKEVKRSDKEIIVIDAPLLIESGLYKSVDFIIVVSAGTANQIARGKARGYKSEIIKKIISNQYSINEKIKSADFVLKNDQSIDKLKEGVDKLWQILVEEKKKS